MAKIIKNNEIVEDNHVLVEAKDATLDQLPEGDLIVPLAVWQANRDALVGRNAGVWLDSDETADLIAEDLDKVALIAVNFPAFTDGRGYSTARLLREQYNYQGELRAIGDVLRDQMFFYKRCGFNAYAVKNTDLIEGALEALGDFSDPYQGSNDDPQPLYRRRDR